MAIVGSRTLNLQRAREIKSLINAELQRIHSGELHIQDVLTDPEDYEIRRCDVYDVLNHVPKLGKTGVRRILTKAKVWPHDRIQDLDDAEIQRILRYLPPRAR